MGGPEIFKVQMAGLFVSGLRRLGGIREVAASLDRRAMAEVIESFPKQPRSQTQCNGAATCHASLCTSQNQLCIDLFDVYSHATLQQNMAPETNFVAMFAAQVRRSVPRSECSFSTSKPSHFRHSASVPKIGDSPHENRRRRGWRAGLAETLTLNAQLSHDNMMRKVEEICYDLERRCYDTETPLRAVEEERDQFRAEAEQLRQQKEELESRAHQASETISNLRNDMLFMERHAEDASSRADGLAADVDATRRKMEEQKETSQRAAESEAEKARTKELDLLATLTEKDDQMEELQTELCEQRSENEEVRGTLDSVSKEKAASLENAVSLRQEIAKLEQGLEIGNQQLAEKDEEIQRMRADNQGANEEITALRKQVSCDALIWNYIAEYTE